MSQTPPTLVVGAGLAGLTAAMRLAEGGRPVVLAEREARVGGLARSLVLDGIVFDTGPHVLFLDDGPAGALARDALAGLPVIRRAFAFAIHAGGRYYRFPNHLDILRYPLKHKLAILGRLLGRKDGLPWEKTSAAYELAGTCGPDLYALLFRDLLTKKIGLSPEALHRDWLTRPDRSVRNGLEPETARTRLATVLAALSQLRQSYAYPLHGFEELARALWRRFSAAGGETITSCGRIMIHVDGSVVEATVGGDTFPVRDVIWTAPLAALRAALGETAPDLPTVTLRLVYLTYDRSRRAKRPFVYTYHADPTLLFNRITYPESIYRQAAPADREGLCLEVNASGEAATLTDAEVIARCLADVERLGLHPASAVRKSLTLVLQGAMPVFPLDYEERLASAVAPVHALSNCFSVGRQGGFCFCLSPGAMVQGIKISDHLLGRA